MIFDTDSRLKRLSLATALSLCFVICSTAWASQPPTLLILGDSLSAGYGVAPNKVWTYKLSSELSKKGINTVNSSVSGDTTSAGLAKLPGLIDEYKPKWLVIALGSNDGLRGKKLSLLRDNLSSMISVAQDNNIKVMLIGFHLPINYGNYALEFKKSFNEVANLYNGSIEFVPFTLDEFAANLDNFQEDQIHPTEVGQEVLFQYLSDNIIPWLEKNST